MKIEGFGNLITGNLDSLAKKKNQGDDFTKPFVDLINNVNVTQKESEKKVEDFVSGNGVELHEVMIAGEKAKTSLELLMEIRNKAVDMYKELTRISV